jgi:hypothetical protein
MNMSDRRDVLLAALGASESRGLTPVQVQKAMFLIAMEAKHLAPSGFYSFDKYNYGPFSADIYSDLNSFAAAQLVAVSQPAGSRVRVYRLTDAGLKAAAAKRATLSEALASYTGAVVGWVTKLSFPDLVRAIYKKYPEYKENSVFRG